MDHGAFWLAVSWPFVLAGLGGLYVLIFNKLVP
jgi:hypothetical protein